MKKYINKVVTLVLLVFSFSQLYAKAEALDFTLKSDVVSISGYDTLITSSISITERVLTWTQNAAENTSSTYFTITNVSGIWNKETSLGTITYSMTLENHQCYLLLKGQESGISARLSFPTTDSQEGTYIFQINAITYQ